MEKSILDTNILMSASSGTTTILNVIEYPKALEKEIQIVWLLKEDYIKAVELMVGLLKIGKPLPVTDVLLAATCINRNAVLVTKDKHFKHIQKIEPNLKARFV